MSRRGVRSGLRRLTEARIQLGANRQLRRFRSERRADTTPKVMSCNRLLEGRGRSNEGYVSSVYVLRTMSLSSGLQRRVRRRERPRVRAIIAAGSCGMGECWKR